jgi:hypothetical protein
MEQYLGGVGLLSIYWRFSWFILPWVLMEIKWDWWTRRCME